MKREFKRDIRGFWTEITEDESGCLINMENLDDEEFLEKFNELQSRLEEQEARCALAEGRLREAEALIKRLISNYDNEDWPIENDIGLIVDCKTFLSTPTEPGEMVLVEKAAIDDLVMWFQELSIENEEPNWQSLKEIITALGGQK